MFSALGVHEARIPNDSSICKRSKTLEVSLKARNNRGLLNVVVESAGLKVDGEGEWKVKNAG